MNNSLRKNYKKVAIIVPSSSTMMRRAAIVRRSANAVTLLAPSQRAQADRKTDRRLCSLLQERVNFLGGGVAEICRREFLRRRRILSGELATEKEIRSRDRI